MRILIVVLAVLAVLWYGLVNGEEITKTMIVEEYMGFINEPSIWKPSKWINPPELQAVLDDLKKQIADLKKQVGAMQEHSMVDLLSDQTDRLLLEIDRFVLEIKQLHIALEKCEELKE